MSVSVTPLKAMTPKYDFQIEILSVCMEKELHKITVEFRLKPILRILSVLLVLLKSLFRLFGPCKGNRLKL